MISTFKRFYRKKSRLYKKQYGWQLSVLSGNIVTALVGVQKLFAMDLLENINNFRSTNVGSYHCCRMRALSKVCLYFFSGSCIAKQMAHGLSLQCRYSWSSGCRKWSVRIFDSGSNFDIIWSKNKHLCGRLPFLMLLFFHPTIIGPPAFKEPIPEIV